VIVTDINEALISEYAKKIYGFAYSKTGCSHDAEDLSQEILMQLCKIDFSSKEIADMDGYIYRVCRYTWSNFVRKNIFVWEGTVGEEHLLDVAITDDAEAEIIKKELYQKLRREIMFLGNIKREVIKLFYFEGKTGKEISEILSIPASTIRWYLGESKKILKERIDMKDSIYTPKKLRVYYCGNATDNSLSGLRDDFLVQNICIVCAKKPITIEEIAQTLCMSAAFIEDKLDKLLSMNYIEKVGANKYRTTFLIKDAEFAIAKKSYEMEHIPAISDVIYDEVKERLDDIRKIGFHGSDLDENFLMWAFVTMVAGIYEDKNYIGCNAEAPIRGDGSKHWLDVAWSNEEIFKECDELDEDLKNYILFSEGIAGAHTGNGKIVMERFIPAIVNKNCEHWRRETVSAFQRVCDIVKENIEPNEYDRELIVQFVKMGYVTLEKGKPRLRIPYFCKEEYAELQNILYDIVAKVEEKAGTNLTKNYAEYIESHIPKYVSAGEREFVRSRFYQPNAYTYILYKEGKLAMPTEEEAKCICSVVWECEN